MDGKLRGVSEPPFCWINKTALRLIRTMLSEGDGAKAAILVYSALCEVSSDQNNAAEFKVGLRRLEELSCYTRRSINKALKNLVRLRMIEIEAAMTQEGWIDWNIYRLLSVEEFARPKRQNAATDLENGIVTHPAIIAVPHAMEIDQSTPDARLNEETNTNNEIEEPDPKKVEARPRAGEKPYLSPERLALIRRKQRRREPAEEEVEPISKHQGFEIRSAGALARKSFGFRKPNLAEVTQFFESQGVPDCVMTGLDFFGYAERCKWIDTKGRHWTDWRVPAKRWAIREKRKEKRE